MTTTLHSSLQRTTISPSTERASWIELRHRGNRKARDWKIFHDSVGEDSRRELKKRTIETYADRHQSVANVVNGDATFRSYGEPIIEQAKRVEGRYGDRNFGLARKSMFLGIDPRNSEEAREAVEYLKQEEIIDSNRFFRTQIVLPEFARKLIGKWNFSHLPDSGYLTSLMFGKILAGSISGGLLGYQLIPNQEGTILGTFAGTLLMGGLTLGTLGLEYSASERFSKQRESFEQALNYLDSEVREHFPLNSGLEIASGGGIK
ncbi:hypothetical protein HY450_03450 [Candidatus Pacearchaeota archaeon]|nr:hypothetical protein [Candidatus Pacearchaeota archaeon]